MNTARRKQLDLAQAKLSEAREMIQEIAEEEQEAFDNLSERLQAAERGQRMQEVAEMLGTAVDEIENVEASISDAMG
jgi:transposase